jgi:hypothetical protein
VELTGKGNEENNMPEMKILVDGVLETGRVNGIGHERGTLYDHLQIRAWKIVKIAGGDFTDGIGSTSEALAQEFGTTGALIELNDDTMIFVGDSHALDANIIARRADRALGGTGVLAKYVVDGYSSGTAAATAPTANRAETALVTVEPVTTLL